MSKEFTQLLSPRNSILTVNKILTINLSQSLLSRIQSDH